MMKNVLGRLTLSVVLIALLTLVLIRLLAPAFTTMPSKENILSAEETAVSVDGAEVEKYLQQLLGANSVNIEKELLVHCGEAMLRRYLESPTDARTARKAAAALALHGIEPKSGEALVTYVKDPRELPNAEDFGTKAKHYGKINMVYLLGRFDSQAVRDFLLRVVDSTTIQDELPKWMELANSQGNEPDALIEMAGFQGRAGIALMLTGNSECRNAVERSYRDVLARAKNMSSYNPELGVRPEIDQVVMSHLIQEMVSAMGVGDCMKDNNSEVCLKYLSTMEGTFYGLGNYFLARNEEVNTALGAGN